MSLPVHTKLVHQAEEENVISLQLGDCPDDGMSGE